MTRLLVSVRSLHEARLAAEAGADLIDLKEPRHGSLGRVGFEVARSVSDALARRRPLSMALGELADYHGAEHDVGHSIPAGIVFAKLGLAQCAGMPDWLARWRKSIQSLPPHCQPVAVIYADWRHAAAPCPHSILAGASANGCRALLIDTWNKAAGDLFAHFALAEIEEHLQRARQHGLATVLAGSLSMTNVAEALRLTPDYLAVRGAVCDGPRDGELCASKVLQWSNLLCQQPA
jgi:(5-formylfuran-3-yl)methyl phosphate synthase